jgi:NAD(P)-dependent dehydrogenase (short-subunit alcohol dehydrogenase family)
MDLGLQGAKALVFGSSSGLGKEVARVLVEEGANVALSSRDVQRCEVARREVGGHACVIGDLTTSGSATAMVESAASQLGGLDVVVVNTGGGKPGGILDTSGFDDAAFNAMLRPTLEIARSASAYLCSGSQSRLIFLTARSVVEATPDLALSSVFRSGVTAAARSLALELAPSVNVNVVVTGQFETPALSRFEEALAASSGMSIEEVRAHHVESIPLKRVGTAREFANVVAFLCSQASSFVTGSVIRVDGGSVRGF